jgi:hypothetical protein
MSTPTSSLIKVPRRLPPTSLLLLKRALLSCRQSLPMRSLMRILKPTSN